VVVIIHQYLREYVDIEPLRYLPDSFHEITAILIIIYSQFKL